MATLNNQTVDDVPILAISYLLAMAMLAQDNSQNSPIYGDDRKVKALHDWRLALPQNLGMSTIFHHPKKQRVSKLAKHHNS